jgi:hypothetical protein
MVGKEDSPYSVDQIGILPRSREIIALEAFDEGAHINFMYGVLLCFTEEQRARAKEEMIQEGRLKPQEEVQKAQQIIRKYIREDHWIPTPQYPPEEVERCSHEWEVAISRAFIEGDAFYRLDKKILEK